MRLVEKFFDKFLKNGRGAPRQAGRPVRTREDRS